MIWWLLAIPILPILYLLLCLYLFRKETVPHPVLSKHYIEILPKKFPTMGAVRDYEKQLDSEPNNIELRTEILLSRLFVHFTSDEKSVEHSFWFLDNAPLNDLTLYESAPIILVPGKEEYKERARTAWRSHIQQSGNNPVYISAAARHLQLIDHKMSIEYWKELLNISPFSTNTIYELARLESWELPRGSFSKHPVPELHTSFAYYRKLIDFPWSDSDSRKVEQLRWKHRWMFPAWLCTLFLRLISSLDRSRNIWNDHYRLSEVGMMAFHFGDYTLAQKCADQFLKIQPKAQISHDYPPIFSTGFSLAAILALKNGNTIEFNKHLDYRANIPADSEFSLFSEDKELLIFLALMNKSDIAVKYIQQRTKHLSGDQEVQDLIDYLKSGGIPYSEEYYVRIKHLSTERKSIE